jgi:hypothetical protein
VNAQFTPGPWLHRRNGYSGGQYDVHADNGRGHLICETSGHDADGNARLIAAAPDLATACRLALGVLRAGEDYDSDERAIDALQSALRKAGIQC